MYAVVLAGGSGTRQRPLDPADRPAPFIRTGDGRTLLQRTVARLSSLVDPRDITIVADRRHGQEVREQVPDATILPEPMGRNTAAAITLATVALRHDDDDRMLVVSADHDLADEDAFVKTIETAERELAGGVNGMERPLVTFGVRPSVPDPDVAYIRPRYLDALRADGLRVYPVDSIEASPGLTRSRELFASGITLWSSGVYLWQREAIREAIERYTPLLTMLEPAHRSELALREAYDRLQPMSIDEAVLEGAARDGTLLAVPLEVGWREVGR
ncbi:MAG: sugar phosphate nucleotidyltransferase [Chloroflexota bacterium]